MKASFESLPRCCLAYVIQCSAQQHFCLEADVLGITSRLITHKSEEGFQPGLGIWRRCMEREFCLLCGFQTKGGGLAWIPIPVHSIKWIAQPCCFALFNVVFPETSLVSSTSYGCWGGRFPRLIMESKLSEGQKGVLSIGSRKKLPMYTKRTVLSLQHKVWGSSLHLDGTPLILGAYSV